MRRDNGRQVLQCGVPEEQEVEVEELEEVQV
jgi:hypothetical protein